MLTVSESSSLTDSAPPYIILVFQKSLFRKRRGAMFSFEQEKALKRAHGEFFCITIFTSICNTLKKLIRKIMIFSCK
jgi:hypothetical protein